MSEQPTNSERPDLDETIKVAEAHTATSRETTISESNQPVPMWIYGLALVAALGAGAIFGKAGNFFNYTGMYKDKYVRAINPDGGAKEKPPEELLKVLSKNGAKVYSKCLGCHQADGGGVAGAFPPLSGSEWITGDTSALAMIIVNGVKGPIQVKGTRWDHNMAAQGDGMSAKDLAAVMTYVRNNLGNSTGDVVTVEMAQAALDESDARGRGQQMTEDELKAKWMKPLAGETMDPATLVDQETLAPVKK